MRLYDRSAVPNAACLLAVALSSPPSGLHALRALHALPAGAAVAAILTYSAYLAS